MPIEILKLFFALMSSGLIVHDVQPTKIVKNGELRISTKAQSKKEVNVSIAYELQTHWYAPIPDQRGVLNQSLPERFIREEGYLDLEDSGSMDYDNVTLVHLGRAHAGAYRNAHKVRVIRKDNKWEADALYHPRVKSTGWVELHLTYKNIPAIGDYTIHTALRE